jgi:4-hydroxy-3-polyprenylbenzoate decarboxylase
VPGRDHQIAKGPIDVLDHASRAWSYGSKLVIDGTVKHPEELGGMTAKWKPNAERDRGHLPPHAEVLDQHQPGGGFWFLTTQKNRAGQGRHVGEWAAHQAAARGVRLIAVLDHETDPRDLEDAVWTMLNNIDPERDVQVIDGGSGPVWVIDATPKLAEEGFTRTWPDKITMLEAVSERMAPLAERLGF